VGRLLVGIVGPPKNLVSLAVLALQIARVDWRLPYPLGQCLLARAVPHGEHTSLVANWLVRGLGASTFAAYPAFRAAPMDFSGRGAFGPTPFKNWTDLPNHFGMAEE
jgi:hypothetical protein